MIGLFLQADTEDSRFDDQSSEQAETHLPGHGSPAAAAVVELR